MLNLTIPQLKKLRLLKSWHSGAIGQTLNVYVFFLAWPFVSIGNSLSFYIFLYLLLVLTRKGATTVVSLRHPKAWLFGVFGLVAVGSTLFSPLNQTMETQLAAMKLVLQLAYWIFLVMFVQTHAPKLNFFKVCKYLCIGTWVLAAQFFFFDFIGELPLIVSGNRNTLVFTLLALTPFHVYYIKQRFGEKTLWLYLPFVILVMLLSEGRAGAVLVLLQSLLIASLLVGKRLQILAKLFFAATLLLFAILYNDANRLALAQGLYTLSPRVAEFVEGKGQAGNLTKDESWLTRKLMIEKGNEIVEKYPLFGVGLMNFTSYEARLPSLWKKEYTPLQDEKNPSHHFNRTSSHNSYLQIWSETGYVGLVCFLLILLFPLAYFARKFVFASLEWQDLPLISLLSICLHFYVIATITSALSWFVIGIAYAAYRGRLNV